MISKRNIPLDYTSEEIQRVFSIHVQKENLSASTNRVFSKLQTSFIKFKNSHTDGHKISLKVN